MIVRITTVIITFFVLITVHEIGHLLAAKLLSLKVTRFSLGYPPILFRKTWRDTEYCLSLIPFGSYTKMPEMWTTTVNKYKKGLVLLAGPFLDFCFALIIFFSIVFFSGVPRPDNSNQVGQITTGFPAERAGIQPGDRIIRINDHTIQAWPDIQRFINEYSYQKIQVTWARDDSIFTIGMIPYKWECLIKDRVVERPTLGIVPKVIHDRMQFSISIRVGINRVGNAINRMATYIFKLFTGRERLNKLVGPIGFFHMANEYADKGILVLLNFVAVLSVYLGFLELLPIPGRDGGHIVMIAVEGIRRKPIPENPKLLIETLGTVILLFLIVYLTINDISKL